MKGEAVSHFRKWSLTSQQPHRVGTGGVEFPGMSAAAHTFQASAKNCCVQENPQASLTLESGKLGKAVCGGGGEQTRGCGTQTSKSPLLHAGSHDCNRAL